MGPDKTDGRGRLYLREGSRATEEEFVGGRVRGRTRAERQTSEDRHARAKTGTLASNPSLAPAPAPAHDLHLSRKPRRTQK